MNSILLVSLLIVLPLVLIVVVVLIRSKRNAARKKNEILKVYREIVSADQLEISEELILYNKILALDRKNKVFIFLHNHDEPVYDVIHLNGLSGCRIEKKGTGLANRRQGKAVSEFHVNEIRIYFLSHDSVLANLLLYSEILDGQPEYLALSKVAEDWQRKLSQVMQPADKLVS
ncbi:MAG: hypothetical protein V4649_05425 [Bacteroidota bacterium]